MVPDKVKKGMASLQCIRDNILNYNNQVPGIFSLLCFQTDFYVLKRSDCNNLLLSEHKELNLFCLSTSRKVNSAGQAKLRAFKLLRFPFCSLLTSQHC